MPTLLVVDDNVIVQRVIGLTLADYDVRVVSVSDPQQAMELMTADPPDMVLAASVLTQISGYDLARWMRNTLALQAVPVLLLVGAFEAVDEAKLAASGASGIIDKPIEPTIVINRVKELLGLKADTKPVQTGRLITSVQGPDDRDPLPVSTDNKPVSSVPDQHAAAAADEDQSPDATPPPAVTSAMGASSKWEQLRDQTGLDADTPSVEHSSARDTLDAAFEDLDQQLSGRAPTMPSPRGPEVPVGHASGGTDPHSRPGDSNRRNPVFEVDDQWFDGEEGPAGAGRDEIAEDLVAPELRRPQAAGAPDRTYEVDDDWFAEGDKARLTQALEQQQLAAEMGIHDIELPEPATGLVIAAQATFEVDDLPAVEPEPIDEATPAAATASTQEVESPAPAFAQSDFDALDALLAPAAAPYTPPAPLARSAEAHEAVDPPQATEAPRPADDFAPQPSAVTAEASPLTHDFAELLAYEQGERVAPPVRQPAPTVAAPAVAHFTDEMLDQIAARVAERLRASMLGDQLRDAMTTAVRETVRSVVADTSERIVRDEIDRIRSKRQDD